MTSTIELNNKFVEDKRNVDYFGAKPVATKRMAEVELAKLCLEAVRVAKKQKSSYEDVKSDITSLIEVVKEARLKLQTSRDETSKNEANGNGDAESLQSPSTSAATRSGTAAHVTNGVVISESDNRGGTIRNSISSLNDEDGILKHLTSKVKNMKVTEKISNRHKEFYKDLSKFQKNIEKMFFVDIGEAYQPIELDEGALCKLILLHFLHNGKFSLYYQLQEELKTVRLPYTKDKSNKMRNKNIYKISNEIIHAYKELHQMKGALKQAHIEPALKWLKQRKKKDKRKYRALTFELHKLRFCSSFLRNDKHEKAALQYCRDNIVRYWKTMRPDIAKLTASLAFSSNLMESPYSSYYTAKTLEKITSKFLRLFCEEGVSVPVSSTPKEEAIDEVGINEADESDISLVVDESIDESASNVGVKTAESHEEVPPQHRASQAYIKYPPKLSPYHTYTFKEDSVSRRAALQCNEKNAHGSYSFVENSNGVKSINGSTSRYIPLIRPGWLSEVKRKRSSHISPRFTNQQLSSSYYLQRRTSASTYSATRPSNKHLTVHTTGGPLLPDDQTVDASLHNSDGGSDIPAATIGGVSGGVDRRSAPPIPSSAPPPYTVARANVLNRLQQRFERMDRSFNRIAALHNTQDEAFNAPRDQASRFTISNRDTSTSTWDFITQSLCNRNSSEALTTSPIAVPVAEPAVSPRHLQPLATMRLARRANRTPSSIAARLQEEGRGSRAATRYATHENFSADEGMCFGELEPSSSFTFSSCPLNESHEPVITYSRRRNDAAQNSRASNAQSAPNLSSIRSYLVRMSTRPGSLLQAYANTLGGQREYSEQRGTTTEQQNATDANDSNVNQQDASRERRTSANAELGNAGNSDASDDPRDNVDYAYERLLQLADCNIEASNELGRGGRVNVFDIALDFRRAAWRVCEQFTFRQERNAANFTTANLNAGGGSRHAGTGGTHQSYPFSLSRHPLRMRYGINLRRERPNASRNDCTASSNVMERNTAVDAANNRVASDEGEVGKEVASNEKHVADKDEVKSNDMKFEKEEGDTSDSDSSEDDDEDEIDSKEFSLDNKTVKLPLESALSVMLCAGSVALPKLLHVIHKLKQGGGVEVDEQKAEWMRSLRFPIELDLGPRFHFHSSFTCAVSRDESHKDNPAMLLRCGHAICKSCVERLCARKQRNNPTKCPICPSDLFIFDAQQLYFD